jgi:hypothetical protein
MNGILYPKVDAHVIIYMSSTSQNNSVMTNLKSKFVFEFEKNSQMWMVWIAPHLIKPLVVIIMFLVLESYAPFVVDIKL